MYLLMDNKVQRVVDYADKMIRSVNMEMAWPAVVALTRYAAKGTKPRFNRTNLLARDRHTCQYCGVKPVTAQSGLPNLEALTIDHVVPKAQSRGGYVTLPWDGARVPVTSWENVVAACGPCNSKKANRTPSEAKMNLRTYPKRPTSWDNVRIALNRAHVPGEWADYIPPDTAEYWEP